MGSGFSEKHNIVYTYDCIEEESTRRNLSNTDSKDSSHSHSWNDQDHTFDYQLDKWVVKKLFQNSDEEITRKLKFYNEEWEN